MKLRDHPLMTYRSMANWPPVWLRTSGTRDTLPCGEIGVLANVDLSRVEPRARCYLTIEFEGDSYLGALLFQDARFCQQIYDILRNQIGHTIEEIGDLDLSHTL